MKIMRFARLGIAAVLSLSSLLVLAIPSAYAVPATCTWLGTSGDHKFSTAANWLNCHSGGIPDTGDTLIFPYGSTPAVTDKAPNNDLVAGTSFVEIVFNGVNGVGETGEYNVTGNAIVLTGDITESAGQYETLGLNIAFSGDRILNTTNASGYLVLSGILSGSGNLTKSGAGKVVLSNDNTFSGTFTASAGSVFAENAGSLGTTAGATSIGNGANLSVGDCDAAFTFAENLTLTGVSSTPSGSNPNAKLTVGATCSGSSADEYYGSLTTSSQEFMLSGNITLGSDVTFGGISKTTTLTGALGGSFAFTLPSTWGGKLIVSSSANTSGLANGTYASAPVVQTLSDDQAANSVQIRGNAVITIDGVRGDTVVLATGTLKGTGTVGDLSVAGVVAPGHSPGCLNTGSFSLTGTYQAEIGGTTPCTGYDQLKVTGTVDVTGGTLEGTLFNGFVPNVGQSYTIIDNDGADAVTGTFAGIAQGGTYTNQGISYTVTYVGGDGNDVVLTVSGVDASSLPASPDTGFALIAAHPLVTLVSSVLAATALIVVARRLKTIKN